MLLFLISCFSFILLSKSLSLKPLPPWASETRLLSLWFWKDLSCFFMIWLRKSGIKGCFFQIGSRIFVNNKNLSLTVDNFEEKEKMSVLDLPELALECILERLSPAGLCNMAGVCSSLRERCSSDHLWERHMKQKWGRVIGSAAYREWQWHIASRKDSRVSEQSKQKGFIMSLSCVWPLSLIRSKIEDSSKHRSSLPVNSIMSWYLYLESGKFWFPAQVYNREHGHVGFMLSCYDAELSYDYRTDTFNARYPPHGRRNTLIEEGVQWDRLRSSPVDTPPHDLHASDCLNDLSPGDHIEVQWRKNKEFPYGVFFKPYPSRLSDVGGMVSWATWNRVTGMRITATVIIVVNPIMYVVYTVILEFDQYTPGSRWRRMTINRKNHQEEGNESGGFYGGIRKLYSKEEISMWKRLWPIEVLE
ncbi:hypothetical protein HHK36_011773 [Tetracentron sinense]|uniref:F-box domain-containing protein n=1 Tax=Tetracentron sinense TaxID=13715 RepID=A0A835DKR2_TETSI|nr:hypothetical protein HHK36_011773 [Tetracentron sinense]